MTLKNGFGKFSLFFISQWMKRSKHGLFVFPPKKTLIRRRHCSIGQSSCGMTSKRSIDRFLENSPERSLNHPKATRVCIRSINQSNRSISVRLLFLFCSRVFISVIRKSLYYARCECIQVRVDAHLVWMECIEHKLITCVWSLYHS